jgi:ADP-heptose:LPS heptosyltransferase
MRRHFPQAHLTVACDPAGAAIAQASDVVNDVMVLKQSWSTWLAALRNAGPMQNYDWALVARGDFDRRLALMARLSNAEVRVGFDRRTRSPSVYFTDPLPLPESEEHRVDTLLRLLKPLGMVRPTGLSVDPTLRVPAVARVFATEVMNQPPFNLYPHFLLINLTRNPALKFREENFIELIGRLINSTQFVIGLVAAPEDQGVAFEIASCMGSDRIASVEAPGIIDLASLLEHATFLITPEGDIAHLAGAVGTPTLVLWHGRHFQLRHSRGPRHAFVHAEPGEATIPVERVWQALLPYLGSYQSGLEKKMADLLEPPPSPGLML